jgi:hypothetical protein
MEFVKQTRRCGVYLHWLLLLVGLLTLGCGAPDEPTSRTTQQLCTPTKLTVASATASSVEHSGKPASAAIDGSMSTRWSSAFSDPQWIKLDLGGTRHISRVVLKWENAASSDYEIQVSENGTNWTPVHVDHSGNGGTDDIGNLSATARYVRMYSHHRTSQYGVSLWEFEVYGNVDPNCDQPPPSTPPTGCGEGQFSLSGATASSAENSGTPASKAVDGNLGTRWSSAFSDPQWIKIDLGVIKHVSRITLHWETAASRRYDLQVSTDGNAWETIYSDSNGNGGTDDISGLSGVGRYVRIYSHTRTTTYGVSLWEVKVHGDANAQCAQPPAPAGCALGQLSTPSASASSVEHSGKTADKAIDGNLGTRWSSQFSNPQWLKIDLGASRFVGRVTLHWENAASRHYDVQVSEDGNNWSTLYTDTNGNGGTDDITNLSGVGRYVRIYSHTRTTNYGVSLWEVKIYGDTNPQCANPAPEGCNQNQLTIPGVFASSIEHSGKPASKATDGNLGTRWSSQFSDPQWLAVDFGGTRHVSRVSLYWEAAASRHYDLQLSPDGTNWTTIYTDTNGNGGTDDITGLSGSGRFLRLFSHTRTTGYGVSLWEMKVYGDQNGACAAPICNHPHIRTLHSGDVEFKVTLPGQQQYVELFVRNNGVQIVDQNIVDSGVANPNGTYTYRVVKPASSFHSGDRLVARFYSYKANSPAVFTPGPTGSVWSAPYAFGECKTCNGGRDTDGDGTCDTEDLCVLNPNKAAPGLCGCDTPDTHSDSDKVPDCLDECPLDPDNQIRGACGCKPNLLLQPAGTPCAVEACSGSRQQSTCDGEGQCGEPDCAPIPGGCFTITSEKSVYWFCDEAVSWEAAEGFCNEEPGRALARIDSRNENAWLAGVLGNSWVGGSDLVQEERWTWSRNGNRSGPVFWLNGLPVPGRYENWGNAGPQGGRCLSLDAGGGWVAHECGESRGFICEQAVRRPPAQIDPPCLCDYFPGVSCDSCGDDAPPVGECTPADQVFPNVPCPASNPNCTHPDPLVRDEEQRMLNHLEVERITGECFEFCSDELDSDCPTYCTGFASVPPEGDACTPFNETEEGLCDLLTIHETARCTLDNPSVCPDGTTCGRVHECAALNSFNQPIACDDPNCTTLGYKCGESIGYCIDPNRKAACDEAGNCTGFCFGFYACGTPGPGCAAEDDLDFWDRCSETRVCPDEGSVDLEVDPLTDVNSNLEEQEFTPATFFPPAGPPDDDATSFPGAKPDGCGDDDPPCSFAVGEHPWCKFKVDQDKEGIDKKDVSDDDFKNDAGVDPQGSGGSEGPIRFDFDPNLSIMFDIGDLKPLGDSNFHAQARASATAAAHFDLFSIGGTVDILDALGDLQVKRCGLTADAHLKLFGLDFLPIALGDINRDALEAADTIGTATATCEKALEDFQVLANKAEKSLRDAQELIRQQKKLVDHGERFSPDLCEQLLGGGVPANFPTADEPFESCDGLTPEDTINLFIRYYQDQVNALIPGQEALLQGSRPILDPIVINFANQPGERNDAQRETQQIANINFAIGPIPMNLTIEAFVQYGLGGALTLKLDPTQLIQAYKNQGDGVVAGVDASVTPFASAGITIFVGAGFDFDPLSAKLGISGDVSLGLVELPVYAMAGLRVTPVPDSRSLADDIKDMVVPGSDMIYPPGGAKQYRFDAYYKFGLEAHIKEILSGTIDARLRVKFFWFSKTWTKQIAKFESFIPEINLKLISTDGDAAIDDFGLLGFVQMPTTFVRFAELDEPDPLPPLPDPNTGGTGGTGTGGASGGASGGGNGGSGGVRPPVSLLVQGDPRYKDFDTSRVEQLFYSGYCDCVSNAPGTTCQSDLDCCDGATCVLDDRVSASVCAQCVGVTSVNLLNYPSQIPRGQHCESNDDCCQGFDREVRCFPGVPSGQEYCQKCRLRNQPAIDTDGNKRADNLECCHDAQETFLYTGPNAPGYPVCSDGCRQTDERCNVHTDCCGHDKESAAAICFENRCFTPTVVK